MVTAEHLVSVKCKTSIAVYVASTTGRLRLEFETTPVGCIRVTWGLSSDLSSCHLACFFEPNRWSEELLFAIRIPESTFTYQAVLHNIPCVAFTNPLRSNDTALQHQVRTVGGYAQEIAQPTGHQLAKKFDKIRQ